MNLNLGYGMVMWCDGVTLKHSLLYIYTYGASSVPGVLETI